MLPATKLFWSNQSTMQKIPQAIVQFHHLLVLSNQQFDIKRKPNRSNAR